MSCWCGEQQLYSEIQPTKKMVDQCPIEPSYSSQNLDFFYINKGGCIFGCCKLLGAEILCSCRRPHRSGHSVPRNFQQDKWYSLFCHLSSLCKQKCYTFKNQNLKNGLSHIFRQAIDNSLNSQQKHYNIKVKETDPIQSQTCSLLQFSPNYHPTTPVPILIPHKVLGLPQPVEMDQRPDKKSRQGFTGATVQQGRVRARNRLLCSLPKQGVGLTWFLVQGEARGVSRGPAGDVTQVFCPPLWWFCVPLFGGMCSTLLLLPDLQK